MRELVAGGGAARGLPRMTAEYGAMEAETRPDLATDKRLRVALMLDPGSQPQWVRRVIGDIQSSSVAEVVLIIRNGSATKPRATFARRLWMRRRYLLYALYTRLDQILFPVRCDAFEITSVEDLLHDVPEITVRPSKTRFTDTFRRDDVQAIRAYDLDVALRFGFRILRGEALDVARYGVWSYHHDDPDVIRGGPPGFWEVMRDDPVTGSMLQMLTEDLDNGDVIYRSWSPTTSRFSVRRNNNHNFWKSSAFVMRKLQDVAEDGVDGLSRAASESAYRMYSRPLYRPPRNVEMLPLVWGLTGRAVARAYEKSLFLDQWALAYRFRSQPSDRNDAPFRFKALLPPKDRFWADPFPVTIDGRYYLFFEEYTYRAAKAHISVVEVDPEGVIAGPFKVLEREYHLSYPFVFEWQGRQYMIPETGSNDSVELYRCVVFPDVWELESVLLEAHNPQDATLVEHDGSWWMFVNVPAYGTAMNWDELHLFRADSPLGPWQPHPRNPVKSDVRSARPAGRLFRRDAVLYRPAQDCSRRYGYAISINRITRLTPHEYAEEGVSKILPEWSPDVIGTHTLNVLDEVTALDYLVRRRKYF
jgi:hypothetical protein